MTSRRCGSETEAKRNINACVKAVAGLLGNTAAVARSAYIHPAVLEAYADGRVDLKAPGDERARQVVPWAKRAKEDDWGNEFHDKILAVKIVDSLDAAIAHINRYGSQHTDAIVTRDLDAARQFVARVDSSAVMVNASTRFNDGGEFGLGAEIGISTDKFHARGPCGLEELTSYKYVVYGNGQVRT